MLWNKNMIHILPPNEYRNHSNYIWKSPRCRWRRLGTSSLLLHSRHLPSLQLPGGEKQLKHQNIQQNDHFTQISPIQNIFFFLFFLKLDCWRCFIDKGQKIWCTIVANNPYLQVTINKCNKVDNSTNPRKIYSFIDNVFCQFTYAKIWLDRFYWFRI